MNTTTPSCLTDEIVRFSAKLAPGQTPRFMDVQPAHGAVTGECFGNVYSRIRERGGSIQHGWTIWEWPGTYLDAEFHAVWIEIDGTYVDVTPQPGGERRVVFLPDSERTYDMERGGAVGNRFWPLSDDLTVQECVSVSGEFNVLRERHTGQFEPPLSEGELERFRILTLRKKRLVSALIIRTHPMGRRAPCPCGSGGSYKRCCGF